MHWQNLRDKSINGESLNDEEATAVLNCRDQELLALADAAYGVRHKYFGNRVKLNFLLNAKSGLCPEDCSYCAQAKTSQAPIQKYAMLSADQILAAAERAVETKAKRFCMVNSGRGPTDSEVEQVAQAVQTVKDKYPQLEICVCLGLLKESQARDLKASGVDAYNHNLNTTEQHYGEICTTHTYQDRKATLALASQAGLSSCSGCLFGMGETQSDIVHLARTFEKLNVDSIPINFLIPVPGTPLAKTHLLTPQKCIKILALFRFLNPDSEIRIAGGREFHLRWLQPLGLYIANSIFIGDYLTTKGQSPADDLNMVRDLGFDIEGAIPDDWNLAPAAFAGDRSFTVQLKV